MAVRNMPHRATETHAPYDITYPTEVTFLLVISGVRTSE